MAIAINPTASGRKSVLIRVKHGVRKFFFEMMAARIGPQENVVMPFNVGECAYFTGLRCLRIGSVGGVPRPGPGEVGKVMRESGVDYVCCTSLGWDGHSEADKALCGHFKGQEAEISYNRGEVWGRCWRP